MPEHEKIYGAVKKSRRLRRMMGDGTREEAVDSLTSKEQFSRLVAQYERLVYTVCFQLARDSAAAEDLTQEAFLSAYLHRDSCPAGYERQWLCRIAANKAKDYLQSAWNRHTVLPGDEEMPPGSPRPRRRWPWPGPARGRSPRPWRRCRSRTARCAGCAFWRSERRKKRPWPWAGR